MTDTSLTDIALTTLNGKPTSLAEFADGAMLVVNVASKCGLTPRYSALEQLAQDYGTRGAVVNRFRPRTVPDAPEVVAAIEAVLPR